jgi:large subunit ribosomal protein L18
VIAQVHKPEIGGDVVKVSTHSRELRRHGWKGSLNSLPACFLIGILLGKKARQNGIEKAILYIGNKPFTSRIAACMKGIVESGMDIPISKETFPSQDRLYGRHIADYAIKIRNEDINKYNSLFSSLIREGLVPENYQSHVGEITSRILEVNLSGQVKNQHQHPSTVSSSMSGDRPTE